MENLFSFYRSFHFILLNLNRDILRPEDFSCFFMDYFLEESFAEASDKCFFAASRSKAAYRYVFPSLASLLDLVWLMHC